MQDIDVNSSLNTKINKKYAKMQRSKKKRFPRSSTKYRNHVLISKLVRIIMKDGEFFTAEKVLFKSLQLLIEKLNTKNQSNLDKNSIDDHLKVIDQVFEKIPVQIKFKKLKLGGENKKIPQSVPEEDKVRLGLKILVQEAVKLSKNTKGIPIALSSVMFESIQGHGPVIKILEDHQRIAKENRVYSDFNNAMKESI